MTDDKTGDVAARNGKPRWLILVVVLVCVLAIGVAIGLAIGGEDGLLNGGPDEGGADVAEPATGEALQTPTSLTAPAPEGETLVSITAPPSETLAMVDAAKLKADALYEITFSPFGYGPAQGGGSLVIRVSEAAPVNPSAEAFDFTGRNVLASVVPGGVDVADGGTYTATLAFRPSGDMLAPVLRDIVTAE